MSFRCCNLPTHSSLFRCSCSFHPYFFSLLCACGYLLSIFGSFNFFHDEMSSAVFFWNWRSNDRVAGNGLFSINFFLSQNVLFFFFFFSLSLISCFFGRCSVFYLCVSNKFIFKPHANLHLYMKKIHSMAVTCSLAWVYRKHLQSGLRSQCLFFLDASAKLLHNHEG